MGGRPTRDRGEVSLQVVLLTPVLLVLVLAVVQTALWYHAAQLAENAASDGASAAARHGAGTGLGTGALRDFVSDAGGALVAGRVDVDGTAMVATATVHVPHVLPGWPDTVTRQARSPIERLTSGGSG
jgi:Flp pilus assembly protein TadG